MVLDEKQIKSLGDRANELRREVIDMIYLCESSSGHFGGSMSAAEIVTVLYWEILNVDPKNPQWDKRDRFVLSKGHSVPILYAALAHKGYFDREILKTYRERGSILQGHPDCLKTPGLDTSSGSLGQGLSVALGMALGARHSKNKFNVYCLLSDGEMDEGMVWEAAMAANHYKVSNLTAIVDYNHLQVDGPTNEIMNIEPLADKWKAFGWEYIVIDGHDINAILSAFENRKAASEGPFVIIANTVKGKGVSYMENQLGWHCRATNKDLRDQAMEELENKISG